MKNWQADGVGKKSYLEDTKISVLKSYGLEQSRWVIRRLS